MKKLKSHYEIVRVNSLGQGKTICKISGRILMKKIIPNFNKKQKCL